MRLLAAKEQVVEEYSAAASAAIPQVSRQTLYHPVSISMEH